MVPAALDVQFRTCTVTLLPVDTFGEATSLLEAVEPRVEADISVAGLIRACAFLIVTCADQLLIILGVCRFKKGQR